MKSYLKISALLCTTAVLIFFACRKDGKKQELIKLEPSFQIEGVQTETLLGQVSIRTDKGGNNVILFKGSGQNNPDRLFILQSDGDATVTVNKDIKNAQVVYLQHAVLINSFDDAERYYFAVDKDEEKYVYEKLPVQVKTYFSVKSYGYGLTKVNGNFPTSINMYVSQQSPYDALNEFRIKKSGGVSAASGGVYCRSGGEGSTSCSMGGNDACSTSCKAGWYACCNSGPLGNSCQCLRDPPQQ